jgi:hypothetical protein
MFAMPEYGFTLSEHDPERPWIVRSIAQETVALPDGTDFGEWAREHYPAPRFSVQQDPWQLGRELWPH